MHLITVPFESIRHPLWPVTCRMDLSVWQPGFVTVTHLKILSKIFGTDWIWTELPPIIIKLGETKWGIFFCSLYPFFNNFEAIWVVRDWFMTWKIDSTNWPHEPWHDSNFVLTQGSVTRDCQIDSNGTVHPLGHWPCSLRHLLQCQFLTIHSSLVISWDHFEGRRKCWEHI